MMVFGNFKVHAMAVTVADHHGTHVIAARTTAVDDNMSRTYPAARSHRNHAQPVQPSPVIPCLKTPTQCVGPSMTPTLGESGTLVVADVPSARSGRVKKGTLGLATVAVI